MTEEELPDPFDPKHREVPTLEELERELTMHVPEAAVRVVENDPQKLALQALRHLDYKLRRAYELHIGLSRNNGPLNFNEVAQAMAISSSNAHKLFRKADMQLGAHSLTLAEMAKTLREEKARANLDLTETASNLSQQEFEALEMVAEGRSWVEVGNELGIGGLSGARELRKDLATRMGIKPEQVDGLAVELVQLAIEAWKEEDK